MKCINKSSKDYKKLKEAYSDVVAEAIVRANTPIGNEDFDIPNLTTARKIVESYKTDSVKGLIENIESGIANRDLFKSALKGIIYEYGGVLLVTNNSLNLRGPIEQSLVKKETLDTNLKVLSALTDKFPGIFTLTQSNASEYTYKLELNESILEGSSYLSEKDQILRDDRTATIEKAKLTFKDGKILDQTGKPIDKDSQPMDLKLKDAEEKKPVEKKPAVKKRNDNGYNNQLSMFQKQSFEGIVASEKTIRDLAARMSDRIGVPFVIETDRTKLYKGKIENGIAYINLAYASLDTPIHEIIGHPLIRAIKDRKYFNGSIDKYNDAIVEFDKKNPNATNEEAIAYANKKVGNNQTDLYQNLLKELEYGIGKEVLDRIKRDYNNKYGSGIYNTTANGKKYTVVGNAGNTNEGFYLVQEELDNGSNNYIGNFNESDLEQFGYNNKYTLEEQQEEALVELLGLMTAGKLDAVKDGKLISLLKRLLKEMKSYMKQLIGQKEIEIDNLPDNMTIGDISDLLAYSNSKLILPGYSVLYTTADNKQFKTYQEASKHVSDLATKDAKILKAKTDIPKIKERMSNLKTSLKQGDIGRFSETMDFENDYKEVEYLGEVKDGVLGKKTFKFRVLGTDEIIKSKDGFYNFTNNDSLEYGKLKLELDKNIKYLEANDIDLNDVKIIDKKLTNVNQIQEDEFLDAEGFRYFKKNDGKWYSIYDRETPLLDKFILDLYNNRKTTYSISDETNEVIVQRNDINDFIDKNKNFEQAKDIIEEWKKVNGIEYNPEEVYSRGQEFVSVVGAYSSFDVNLMMQNLLQHIEDNEKAGGQFAISAFTRSADKRLHHLENGGGTIRFKMFPQSKDILWAANTDVYSGSVWDASEKISKDSKSELLGVSYTKYPSLNNINAVQPNLASIIENIAHAHNELGIVLTGNNFRLEYDEDIPYTTKKIIDSINSILDQKYGKAVKPEIKPFNTKDFYDVIPGFEDDSFKEKFKNVIQPTQTDDNLKETINNVKNKINGIITDEYGTEYKLISVPITKFPNSKIGDIIKLRDNDYKILDKIPEQEDWDGSIDPEMWEIELVTMDSKKEYNSQALINSKIAKIKEVAKAQPRSLIRSEVVKTREKWVGELTLFPDDFPFQKIPESNISYQTEANKETVDKLKALLTKLNIPLEVSERLLAEFGVNGLADGIEGLIKIAAGMEGVALAEETMHMITMMVPQEILQPLLDAIENYQIYYDTLSQYGQHPLYLNDDGSTNIDKIKLEAVGKLLAEYYIMEVEGLSESEVNTAKLFEKDKSIFANVWQSIKNWISTVFGTNKNEFQQFIKDLNSGKLPIGENISRAERLASLEFTRETSIDIATRLSTNKTFANLQDPALSNDPNIKTMNKLVKLVNEIKDTHQPIVQNLKDYISLNSKSRFATSALNIDKATEATELKDMMIHSIEYLRSTYYNVEVMKTRANQIAQMLESGTKFDEVTQSYVPINDMDRLLRFNEAFRINEIMTMYSQHMSEYGLLFRDEKDIMKIVSDMQGSISTSTTLIESLNNRNIIDVFDKVLAPKVAEWKKLQQKKIMQLQDIINNTTSARTKRKREAELKEAEYYYNNPPVSGKNVLDLLLGQNIDNVNSFFNYMEGGMTHRDEAVQAVANYLANINQGSMAATSEDKAKLNEIFEDAGLKQNLSGNTYEDFTETVTRYSFNKISGELEEYQARVLIDEFKQWQFENDLEVIGYLIRSAESGMSSEDLSAEYKKYFGVDLTTQERLNVLDTMVDKRATLLDNFGTRKYIDKYYEIQKILNDTLLSDGRTVREIRKPLMDRSNEIDEELEIGLDVVAREILFSEKIEVQRRLKALESPYDSTTGLLKQGDELLIAETLIKWREAKNNVEMEVEVNGNLEIQKVKVDEIYFTNASKARWEEEKYNIENKLQEAQDLYAADNSPINKANLEEVEKEYDLWKRVNVKQTVPQAFYDEREDILLGITQLLEALKTDEEVEVSPGVFRKIEEVFAEETDAIWKELRYMTKELRDTDGIIDGSLGLALSSEIKYLENRLAELKQQLNEIRTTLRDDSDPELKDNLDLLGDLYKKLSDIQETPLTEYWEKAQEAVMIKIEDDHYDATGENITPEQLLKEYEKSDFFRDNVMDVTKQYGSSQVDDLPASVFIIGKKIYKPIYTWRHTVPKGNYQIQGEMSSKWASYKVNSAFENPNYQTIQGKVSIDKSKAVSNGITNSRYVNSKYGRLNNVQKTFLSKAREFYYNDQMKKPMNQRTGDELPRISDRAIHKKIRLAKTLKPSHWSKLFMFNKEKFYENFGINKTEDETMYGEGAEEGDSKLFQKNQNKLRIKVKYLNRSLPIETQEKDLFRLLSMHNEEVHRVAALKESIPTLNSIYSKIDTSTSRGKTLDAEIQKRVNKKTRNGNSKFSRVMNKILDFSQAGRALTMLFLPHHISPTLKNSAMGAFQIFVNSSKLRQYSEGSFRTAYYQAFKGAYQVANNQFSSRPTKYMALMKRLNIVTNLDNSDSSINNVDMMVKVANGVGYGSGYLRRLSETHLELTMFELVRQSHLIDGADLLDAYEYVNGEVVPKTKTVMDVHGNPIKVPVITPEQERLITNKTKNMQQFTQGNFSTDNAVLAKQYWLGRVLLFMKGYVYNPAQVRFGKKRILSTGQETEGFYRVLKSIFTTDMGALLHTSRLTDNEKDAVYKFKKDVMLVNFIGGLIYGASVYLKDSGDSDEDSPFLWYTLLMARKTYAEAAAFSVPEYLGKGYALWDDDKRMRGNEIENLITFAVARPASEFAMSAFLPVDIKGMRFEDDDIKTKDPFYSQFKDNWVLFDFLKAVKAKPDMLYPESSLNAYTYYDKSAVDYDKPEKGGARKKSSGRSSSRRSSSSRKSRRR